MLGILWIIAMLATGGLWAVRSLRCASERSLLVPIQSDAKAQWVCGEVLRSSHGGVWSPGRGRWTELAAALARPAPGGMRP
ncbi:hypothetical protein PLANPX_4598 [Lacipirellula parvula]|uniref:Uncharacterized protein n=1 Tax=Lacipirellula parvula TaxID=2650471 RepID=A0A5K7XKF8_9BACT|nr:hypothetical protein PLANPX_4598 [Lacipirellula parvula]